MRVICIITLLLLSLGARCQNWVPLDKGIGSSWADIRQIYADTNYIYIVGAFTEDGNNIPMRGIAKWNGIKWDSVGDANKYNATKTGIYKYHDTLMTSNQFYDVSNVNFAKLNGAVWDTITNSLGLGVVSYTERNGILYFGGGFYKCGNDSTHFIGKYDGATLSGLTPPYFNSYGDAIICMTFFQDTLYVGGVLYLYPPAYTLPRIAGFAKWDGINLLQVSPEFSINQCAIDAMVVYKNELYIGGQFTKLGGFTGDYIMKWDGHNFTEVGGGANQEISSMVVYNNELYVGGRFTQVGSIISKKIAKWNGSQWTSLNTDDFDQLDGVKAICIYKDELYVAGYFRKIGNDSISSIAKYNHPLMGVKDIMQKENSLFLKPNPTTDFITIGFKDLLNEISEISVYDVLGKRVKEFKHLKKESSFNIDVRNLSTGIYLIKLTDKKGLQYSAKFIKN